jgi:acetyl esterase/lipase
MQVGADELLLGDAPRMRDALLRADVTVRFEIGKGLWHGFHLHAGMLKTADAAIDRAGRFVSDRVAHTRYTWTDVNSTRTVSFSRSWQRRNDGK